MVVPLRILNKRIVPVVALDHEEPAEPQAVTLLGAGLDVIEITFRTTAAAAAIHRLSAQFPQVLVGAGTVLEPDQFRGAVDAGAQLPWRPDGHTGIKFISTGGINPGNMRSYLERPSVAAIDGSWMVEKKLITARDWSRIGQLTREALAAAHMTP